LESLKVRKLEGLNVRFNRRNSGDKCQRAREKYIQKKQIPDTDEAIHVRDLFQETLTQK